MQVFLDVVEIDPEIVKVAKKWFDCKEDERLRIITGDGLEYINKKANENGTNTLYRLRYHITSSNQPRVKLWNQSLLEIKL